MKKPTVFEKTIRIDARDYRSLTTAERDYALEHGLQGFDLSPRWASGARDEILLTVPTGPEDKPSASTGGSVAADVGTD